MNNLLDFILHLFNGIIMPILGFVCGWFFLYRLNENEYSKFKEKIFIFTALVILVIFLFLGAYFDLGFLSILAWGIAFVISLAICLQKDMRNKSLKEVLDKINQR